MGKVRATISTRGVAKQRHDMYAGVMERVNESIKAGFYLEAITFLESIISDRLESFCNEQTCSSNLSFKCMGTLIIKAEEFPISDSWLDLMKRLKEWKKSRNEALHQMAKIEVGDISTFSERYNKCKSYANDGKKLFREIDNEIRKYRKLKLQTTNIKLL